MGGGIARYVGASTEVDRATAAETMFDNFIAKNNLPLTTTDDFSKTVGTMFPDSDIAKKVRGGGENHDHPDHQGIALAPDFNRIRFLLL